MTTEVPLRPTLCAICGRPGNARELYAARLAPEAFSPEVFSARRLPDNVHYRMVRCADCGLVRSDPIADPDALAALYRRSEFGYADQVPALRRTYRHYLDALDQFGAQKGALLEVGCGNGFFLETAREAGYAAVHGVEPSADAVAKARPDIRPGIVRDVMRPGLFATGAFDVVCLFQVLDHLPDPGPVLDECLRVLRPGGLILCLNHNVEAFSARIMRERSPIVDVEHTYLYGPATMGRMFAAHGFHVRRVATAWNISSVPYLVRLAPLPAPLKRGLLSVVARDPFRRMEVRLPLGNLYLVGQKPDRLQPEA